MKSIRLVPSERPTFRVLAVVFLVSVLATIASWTLPDGWVALGVGAVFLGATWFLVLRHREVRVEDWGLSLGGMLEQPPGSWTSVLRKSFKALGWFLLLAALIFPAFVLCFARYWHVDRLAWSAPPRLWDVILGQLIVVALPEEVFFRGYVQTAFDRIWQPRWRLWGAPIGAGLLFSSLIFAVGHLATIPSPSRLAVFFPSLLFGWLRARTGGIGASVLLHAASNLLTDGLGRGTGAFH